MGDITLRYLLFGEDRSASKTFKGVGDAAESTASRIGGMVSRLGGAVGGDFGELLSRASAGIDALGGSGDKMAKRLGAAGGVALASGVAMQKMASGDVEAHNALVNAVENSGASFDDFAEQVDNAIASQVHFGNSDGEVQTALARLTDATHDPAKALNDLRLATDLAAAKHISLADAATLVGKAHNGSTKFFKEFGVDVGKNADGTADYDGALASLASTLSGRAEAAQDSFSGKLREGRAWLDNAASGFAESYGPAITAAGAALSGLAAVTELSSLASVKNAAATVVAKAAQAGSAVATGVATAAQWAWNAAISANPIGLIIIAIAAFVAAILWLWNNCDWFRNGVTKAWEAIKAGWSALWDNVLKPGIDAFGAAFRWLWNAVLAPTIRFILNGFASLTDGLASLLDMLGNVPGFEWARTAAETMRGAAQRARDLAQGIKDINNQPDPSVNVRFTASYTPAFATAMNALNSGRKLAGMSASIPGYATGVTNARGGLAIVGEQGPELVRLPPGSDVYTASTTAAMLSNPTAAGRGAPDGGMASITLQLDGRTLAQQMVRVFRQSGGSLGIAPA